MPVLETPAIQDESCELRQLHPEAIAQARASLPTDEALEVAGGLLKAVADPTRLRLLAALGRTELCVCDLSAVIGVSESAISHQLRLLREHRLVTPRKVGRVVYYRLADHHVTELLQSALEHASEGRHGSRVTGPCP